MFVFISFGVWVVAFGDGMGGVSSPPSSFGTGGYPDVRPLGEMYPILDMKRHCVVTQMFAL